MNLLRRQLKSEARQLLQPRWSGAIASVLFWALAVCLIILFELLGNLIFGVTTPYTLFSAPQMQYANWAFLTQPAFWVVSGAILLSLLLLLPLSVGRAYWYCGAACGDGAGAQDLAAPFRSLRAYGRTLYLGLQWVLRQLALGLLFLLVPFGIGLLGMVGQMEWNWPEPVGTILTLLSLLIGICAAFLYLVVIQRYMLVPYLILRTPEQSARAVFRRSREATRGMRLELAVVSLSFWYWLLACLTFFPLLYAMPYYGMTRAVYARTLLDASPIEAKPGA